MAQIELLVGERQARETRRAVIACNGYLRLGAGRSLRQLAVQYRERARSDAPTRSLSTLNRWSQDFAWQARTAIYDAHLEAEKNERRRQIMESGLALDYERVTALKRLVDDLAAQYYAEEPDGKRSKLWLRDVKGVGNGVSFQVVDLERFNAPLIEQYRGALDDLAQETGGRRPKPDTTPLGIIDYGQLSDAQLERIANGEEPLKVLLHGGLTPGASQGPAGAAATPAQPAG